MAYRRDLKHGEFIVAMLLIGGLVTAATPYYLSVRAHALDGSAQANLAQAVMSARIVYDDRGTYSGMTVSSLRTVDATISPHVEVLAASGSSFCLRGSAGERVWYASASTVEPTRAPCA